MTPRTSIIIPALDEGPVIGAVVRQLRECVPLRRACITDIVVVDNGSTDDTSAQARAAGARVIWEPRRGYGRACLTGVYASPQADIIVQMDGDGSDMPEDVLRVWGLVQSGAADLAMGSRTHGSHEPGALTPQQLAGNAVGTSLLRLLYGVRLTDIGPLRAIRRETLLRLQTAEMTYGWPAEMLVKAARLGLCIAEVSVDYRRRAGGKSKVAGTLIGTLKASYSILSTILRYARWQPEGDASGPAFAPRANGRVDEANPAPVPGTGWRLKPRLYSQRPPTRLARVWERDPVVGITDHQPQFHSLRPPVRSVIQQDGGAHTQTPHIKGAPPMAPISAKHGAAREGFVNEGAALAASWPLARIAITHERTFDEDETLPNRKTRQALFIVARLPVVGQAKTRLARDIGANEAADLYRAFLRDLGERFTVAAARDGYDLVWYYTAPDGAGEREFAACVLVAQTQSEGVRFMRQGEGNLGTRLWQGFHTLHTQGYEQIVVLGSDSPHVPAAWIADAFRTLDTHDVVIGPAHDGGYYLLGQRGAPVDLFMSIPMSTPVVCAQTVDRAREAGLSVAFAPATFDIDHVSDLVTLSVALETAPSSATDEAPATLAVLQQIAISDVAKGGAYAD